MYFLVVGLVMFVGTRYPQLYASAFSPYTTWGPLMLFVSISIVMEGIADKKRHVSDHKTNTDRCIVLENETADTKPVSESVRDAMNRSMINVSKKNRQASARGENSALDDIPWPSVDIPAVGGMHTEAIFRPIHRKDIRQGHLVVVRNREMIPADMVLVASSGDRGCAYIETSSIDGETNLKLRVSAKHKTDPSYSKPLETINEAVQRIAGFTAAGCQSGESSDRIAELITEAPNAHINTFAGVLKFPSLLTTIDEEDPENPPLAGAGSVKRELPLGAEHLLLRGAVLRNTEWAIGITCFTGTDTKLSQNTIETPSKMSQLDLITNKCVLVMILVELICISYLSTMAVLVNENQIDTLWCVLYVPSLSAHNVFCDLFCFQAKK